MDDDNEIGLSGRDEFEPWFSEKTKNKNTVKTLILIDNDDIMVTVDHRRFQIYMIKWLKEHPHLSNNLAMLKEIDRKAENVSTVNCVSLLVGPSSISRFEYRLADLLEQGKCLILNKKDCRFIDEIEITEYGEQIADLIGSGGRAFSVAGKEFLRVQDWIS